MSPNERPSMTHISSRPLHPNTELSTTYILSESLYCNMGTSMTYTANESLLVYLNVDSSGAITMTAVHHPPIKCFTRTTISILPQKRTQRYSPFLSPMKLTRSPLSKMQRRLHTGTEGKEQAVKPQVPE